LSACVDAWAVLACLDGEQPAAGRSMRLNSRLAVALGDCFAIATATARELPLLTGEPEIVELPGLPCDIEDLAR
jgi:PIN domain nuclease of toxin-antitoxin system